MRISFDAARLAHDILAREGIYSFPFDPLRIAARHNIKVFSYGRLSELSGQSIQDFLDVSADGFSSVHNGTFFIAYNRDMPSLERRRWTITHELAHILLDHIGDEPLSAEQEAEAEQLTVSLLCPLPVAHLIGDVSAQDLHTLFGLSKWAADRRFNELCRARQHAAEVFPPRVMQSYANFSPFVSQCAARLAANSRRRKYREVLVEEG